MVYGWVAAPKETPAMVRYICRRNVKVMYGSLHEIEHTGTTLGRDMMGELSPQDDARTVRKVMDEGRLANEEIEIMSRRLKRRKRTQDNMRDKRTKERRKSVVTY